jgi:uncharacterized protein (UPF0147 family)
LITDEEIDKMIENYPIIDIREYLRKNYGDDKIPKDVRQRVVDKIMEKLTGHKQNEISEDLLRRYM